MVAADTKAKGAVLYCDHAGHLTPLTLTYHATASRQLTSGRSDIIPPSTSVEVETAYCPRCLTFCDAASASTSFGVCQKDSGGCKDCPLCFSPVSVSIDKKHASTSAETHLICHYVCGHCLWSSQECGVTVDADKLLDYSNNDKLDEREAETQRLVAISEITTELENCFQRKVSERNKVGDSLFYSIGEMWAKREQQEERRKRMMIGSTIINDDKKKEKNAWSLRALEDSLAEKKRGLESLYLGADRGDEAMSSSSSDDDSQAKNHNIPTSEQVAAQMFLTTAAPRYQKDLLPLPVRFRTRVSRRCRAEQAAGRTGILMKPQLNPLAGDTSLRAGHGQWWKKDSSAIHVVPRVQVCRYGTDATTGKAAALLKVKNPTLSMIRLRFSGPNSNIDTKELENMLVDPFTETTIAKADLCSSDSLSSIVPTDWIELDSAEDLLLDVGKRQEDDPEAVRSWNQDVKLLDASERDTAQLTIVATRGDTSWMELVLPKVVVMDPDIENSASNHAAVPLSMQIEVGNGSWEASLIKRRDLPEQEQDLVQLDFVVLLHM